MPRRRERAYDRQLRNLGARLAYRVDDIPQRGECWMCGGRVDRANREHIFPGWIQRRYGAEAQVLAPTHYDRLGKVITRRSAVPLSALVAGEICQANCNGGWMSRLENDFRKVLFEDNQNFLDRRAQEVVARWFSKTAIVLNTSQNYRTLVPARQRHACARRVPPGFAVYLGAVAASEEAHLEYAQGSLGIISTVRDSDEARAEIALRSEKLYACAVRIDTLVGYVVYAPPQHWAVPDKPLTRIWPPEIDVVRLDKLTKLDDILDGLSLIDWRMHDMLD